MAFDLLPNVDWRKVASEKWRQFVKLGKSSGNPVRSLSGNKPAFRATFQRYFWGAVFLALFLYGLNNVSDDGVGSEGNMGLLVGLVGAVIATAAGAFLSPRLTELFWAVTPAARRDRIEHNLRRAYRHEGESKRRSRASEKKDPSSASQGPDLQDGQLDQSGQNAQNAQNKHDTRDT